MHVMPNQTAGFLKACKYLCTASLHSHFSSNIWRMQDTCSTAEIHTDDPQQFRLHTGMFICTKQNKTKQKKNYNICDFRPKGLGYANSQFLATAMHLNRNCTQRYAVSDTRARARAHTHTHTHTQQLRAIKGPHENDSSASPFGAFNSFLYISLSTQNVHARIIWINNVPQIMENLEVAGTRCVGPPQHSV
jgi:hypothetical protein